VSEMTSGRPRERSIEVRENDWGQERTWHVNTPETGSNPSTLFILLMERMISVPVVQHETRVR
jgi:hypothetical protein